MDWIVDLGHEARPLASMCLVVMHGCGTALLALAAPALGLATPLEFNNEFFGPYNSMPVAKLSSLAPLPRVALEAGHKPFNLAPLHPPSMLSRRICPLTPRPRAFAVQRLVKDWILLKLDSCSPRNHPLGLFCRRICPLTPRPRAFAVQRLVNHPWRSRNRAFVLDWIVDLGHEAQPLASMCNAMCLGAPVWTNIRLLSLPDAVRAPRPWVFVPFAPHTSSWFKCC